MVAAIALFHPRGEDSWLLPIPCNATSLVLRFKVCRVTAKGARGRQKFFAKVGELSFQVVLACKVNN